PISRAKIPAKSRTALPERSICIRQLAFAGEQSCQPDCAAVKSILRGYLELLTACHWLVVLQAWRGAVIWNYAKNPLTLNWRHVVVLTRLNDAWLSWIAGQGVLTKRNGRNKSESGGNT